MSREYVMQLEATIANLERDKVLLKEMKNEQDKVLEILKPYLRLVNNYLQAKMPLVDNNSWINVKEITDKEELELLKRCLNDE